LKVGISLDGLAEQHDENRLDRKGRPTHHRTMRGVER
jgi:sulfatase maturation enzyme AslB (radical SAM superfamily)